MSEPFHYEEIHGEAIRPFLRDLGGLRITVFREYPYLYDGDLAYEEHYLETYVRSPRSCVVLLRSGDRLVGATTCLPMADESPEFQAPFLAARYDLDEIFYFGESIILPEFRGRGAGHEFFKRREAHAERVGPFRYTAFCSVDRPTDHPVRPPGHIPLDAFWTRMGYTKQPELKCALEWKEIGEEDASSKQLSFWMKEWFLNAGVLALLVFASMALSCCRTLEKEPPTQTDTIDKPTFALIDADADGKVSPAEMAVYKHDEGLAEVDLDNDKRVSSAEWKAARPSAPPDDGTFTKLDLNRDGFLAKEEAITSITGQAVFCNAFKKMDANADGFLVWEEYTTGDAASLDVTLFSSTSTVAAAGGSQ